MALQSDFLAFLLEDQSQPLPSPLSLDGVTDTSFVQPEMTEKLSDRLSRDVEGSP